MTVLCFHIGLPKTATTYLQWSIFPTIARVDLIHQSQGDKRARKFLVDLKNYCTLGRRRNPLKRTLRNWSARRQVLLKDRVPAPRCTVFTSENISMTPNGVWTGDGPPPAVVAERLAITAEELGVAARHVKIIFGLRSQAPWLASRYAESSKSNSDFAQVDFEKRLETIANSCKLSDPLQWLDYAGVHEALSDFFEPENLLLLPLETLAGMTELGCRRRIADFLGVDSQALTASPPAKQVPLNALALSGESWRLKSGAGQITLTPPMAAAIAQRFASSNHALYVRTGIDLSGVDRL